MAIDRPTFHEAWYRVAQLRPRLLSGVQVYRQHFRGKMWYVLENPSNNKFSRISIEAYRFIAMLDGKRTVSEAWGICNDQTGDNASTQGEVIQLLGQLYCSNLLFAEMAPDTESLFNRYRTRITRQIQGYLTNILFIRIPLLDPDHFLDRWHVIFGKIFSLPGLILWLAVMFTGLYFAIGNLPELFHQSSDVLAPNNLILLYLTTLMIKVVHEFGHAFACKKFGKVNGSRGEIHVMGVMFLVFVPLPYVDASSAWAFREKRHRVIVGIAGVMVELFVAACAMIIWAYTSTGTIHIIAYNVIFVASISTLIFNGNPLLRFDAYYVLSDLLEIPNFSHRSKEYIYYLVKRYCWGIRGAHNPAHTRGESRWFFFYGIASSIYRIFICVRILLFLNDRLPEELFIIVPILAGVSIIMWVLVPIGKFFRYLAVGHELSRNRGRAINVTLATTAVMVILLCVIKFPDYCRVEGFVEPFDLSVIHMETDGFITECLPSGSMVEPTGKLILKASNKAIETEKQILLAQLTAFEVRRQIAETQEIAAAQIITEQIETVKEQIAKVDHQLSLLNLHAPKAGQWVSPDIERIRGGYIHRGERIGYVAHFDRVIVRATAEQELAALLVEQAHKELEIRVKDCPKQKLKATLEQIFPSGHEVLPSRALGYAVGGTMATEIRDPRGIKTAEKFFEIRIRPEQSDSIRLIMGQRVIARVQLRSKPLAMQWWYLLRQLFQRRFHI